MELLFTEECPPANDSPGTVHPVTSGSVCVRRAPFPIIPCWSGRRRRKFPPDSGMEMKIYLATFRVSSLSQYDTRLKNARPPIHSLTSPICLRLRRVGWWIVSMKNESACRTRANTATAIRLSLPISAGYQSFQSLRLSSIQVASVRVIRCQKIRDHRVPILCTQVNAQRFPPSRKHREVRQPVDSNGGLCDTEAENSSVAPCCRAAAVLGVCTSPAERPGCTA